MRLRTRTENTRRLYRSTLNSFERFLGRPATLDDLSDSVVSRYLTWVRRRGLSPHSAEKERCNLLCLWRWACRRRDQHGQLIVANWPDVEPEVLPEGAPQAWNRSDLYRLFHAVLNTPGRISGVPACDWWRCLLLTLWDSGERISAIMLAEWEHLNTDEGWLIVPAEHRKGRRRTRTYHLHADTLAALDGIREPERDRIFPWPYTETYLWNRFGKVLERAGLPNNSKSKFHRIRRSVATWAEVAGANATALLDHTSRRVTEAAYLDPTILRPASAADVLFRPDAPPPGRDGAKPQRRRKNDRRAG